MKKLLLALAVFSGSAFAATEAYDVKGAFEFESQKSELGIVVIPYEEATIEVGEVDNPVGRYVRMSALVSKGNANDMLTLDMEVEFHSGTKTFKGRPQFVVRLGEPARVIIQEQGGRDRLTMNVTVKEMP